MWVNRSCVSPSQTICCVFRHSQITCADQSECSLCVLMHCSWTDERIRHRAQVKPPEPSYRSFPAFPTFSFSLSLSLSLSVCARGTEQWRFCRRWDYLALRRDSSPHDTFVSKKNLFTCISSAETREISDRRRL